MMKNMTAFVKLLILMCISFELRSVEACKCSCDCCGKDDDTDGEGDSDILFYDEFDNFDLNVWQHEITSGGGGNGEFQYYTNNRSNSYIRDGVLYIKPTLTADKFNEAFLGKGELNLEGSYPANLCTGRQWNGCRKFSNENTDYLNPIQSARIRTVNSFSFSTGKLEIEAQMPKGDWLWPAIWLLPKTNRYGDWPASGEIDVMETRGNEELNDAEGNHIGASSAGATMHWGAYWPHNAWYLTHKSRVLKNGSYADGFHKYTLEKTSTSLKVFVDDDLLLDATPPSDQSYFEWANFSSLGDIDNPWRGGSKMAPFDQEYYIILNVAVGGTTGFFPDMSTGPRDKPWINLSSTAKKDFYEKKSEWYPTWNGEDAAMKVKYVKVTKIRKKILFH